VQWNWGGIVGIVIATGWTVQGSNWDYRIFSSPKHLDHLWGPPSLLLSGCQGSLPQVKQAGHEVNYSPPSTSQVKNEWSCTSTFPISLGGMVREYYITGIKFIWLVLDTHTN